MRKLLLLFLLLWAIPLFGQGTQIQSGPVNPTFCKPGAFFYNTTTTIYQQCITSGNGWTQVGGGGGGAPGGVPGDTQCNVAGSFGACQNSGYILYVSPTGNDSNSGRTWDSAKLTIMAAVCALPGGDCTTTPRLAGAGTVMFTTGVACNSIGNAGCWIAGSGDSQYPGMSGSLGGPSWWTIEDIHGDSPLSFVCATKNATTGSPNNGPFCQVVGPNSNIAPNYAPLFWISGNSLGPFYINGMSGTDGTNFTAAWGRIGIDSATAQIISPVVTQTVDFTIENTYSTNFNGGSTSEGRGPQLAIGNGFWMHLRDSGFGQNVGESCLVTSATRTSNEVTVVTNGCGANGTRCPVLNGDHVSFRDVVGDGNAFNGTFTADSACGNTNQFTYPQTGPNASATGGVVSTDRTFGIVCYGCQIEMSRMHAEGAGIKFYSGPSANLELNDYYQEGFGALTQPLLWISPLLYGQGGLIDVGGLYLSDTPTLPSVINDSQGPVGVFVHTERSQSTSIRGPVTVVGGNDATNRTTGLVAGGGAGWYDTKDFEASLDIARRQVPMTSVLTTNLAIQNPALWTGGSFTTTGGMPDPFGGTGAIEIDASSGTQAFFYNVTQNPNVGDIWVFGGWFRAVNGSYQFGQLPLTFYLGSGNQCRGWPSQQVSVFSQFLGDGNWSWVSGTCQVWSNPNTNGVALATPLNAATPVQVYRPFLYVIPAASPLSATELADEINSLAFGPSITASAGDIVYPPDKRIGISSGTSGNEYLGYLTHSNTANRSYTFPDSSGSICISTTCPAFTSVTAAYDTFNRANNPVNTGAPVTWQTSAGAVNVSSNIIVNGLANWNSARVTSPSFAADQFSEATVITVDGNASGPGVHLQSGVVSGYYCNVVSTGHSIARINNSAGNTNLVSDGVTPQVGDVVRCEISGTTLRYYVNGVQILTTTDSTFTTGLPGFIWFQTTSSTFDNWYGGNYQTYYYPQLNTEQDWSKPQHLLSLSLGAPSPASNTGALVVGGLYSSLWTTNTGLCTDSTGVATTTGCPAGGISGMTAGQVPIAATAATITSSKALQGTDTNILSSGTVSGTASPLCTDANGGATTSGCVTTTMVYNTSSGSTNTNISATNMVASTGALHSYMFGWTISLSVVGASCTGSTTVVINAIFTDPNGAGATTEPLGTVTIANTGNGTLGFVANGIEHLTAKTGTAVQYSTSNYTAGSGCVTNPTYQVIPSLIQLW